MEILANANSILDPDSARSIPNQPQEWGSIPDAIEYFYENGWTDGLPVVPCTRSRLDEFLAQTSLDPDTVILEMRHLNRGCTVREAAINAVMAGCLPEYFPVVLAAWKSFDELGIGSSAIWQSTTGTAPFLIVGGPLAERLEINSAGNIFGSGFRANAAIGRAIRLISLNVFKLRPHLLDQATHGNPAKYTCCIAENDDENPWPSHREERGFAVTDSTVTTMLVRGSMFIEARQTSAPEQLLLDVVDSAARTGQLVASSASACIVFSPEHAQLLAGAGWSKDDVREFISENSVRDAADLHRVGKGAVSHRTRWRVPADHPDAVEPPEGSGPLRVIPDAQSVEIFVAGANNAGVSTILQGGRARYGRPPITRIDA